MSKKLFIYPHGLGDLVMATPALKMYKKNNPDTLVHISVKKNHNDTANRLLSGLDFIDEIIPCLSDPWNDFDSGYGHGLQEVYKEAKKIRGYDDYILIPTARYSTGIELHKIFRVAKEIGVEFSYLEDLQTILTTTEEAEKEVDKYIKNLYKPFIVLHTKAGNDPKTLMPIMVEKILSQYPYFSVLEFDRKSTERSNIVPIDDMEFSKALIKRADLVIAIDSVVMHIAGAFRRPMNAIFTRTPVHQAVPITYRVDVAGQDNEHTNILKWNEYKKEIYDKYPQAGNVEYDERWYYEGGSASYQGYWYGERNCMGLRINNRTQSYIDVFPEVFDNCTVLDVGCAGGYFVKYLRDVDVEAYGCDPSNWIINREETLMTPYKEFIKVGTAQSIPFDKKFDTVLVTDVLEHLTENELDSFFKELDRVETKNLIVKVPLEGEDGAYDDPGHILIKSKEWWFDRLEKIGFKYVNSSYYSNSTTWLFKRGVKYDDEADFKKFVAKSYQPIPLKGYENITEDKYGCESRWKFIFPILARATKPINILDIGCSSGYFSFLSAGLGHNVVAIDNDKECIHYMKYLIDKENIKNIKAELVDTDLLDHLNKYDDNHFDIVYYMGVHHHIYEQYILSSSAADNILREISRITTDMIFSMGQPDEEGNKFTAWKGLIPKFNVLNVLNDITDYVNDTSYFVYGMPIGSYKMHNANRYIIGFSKDKIEAPKIIRFNQKGFTVDEYLWSSTNCSLGTIESSTTGFPTKNNNMKNRVRYYKVHDYTGKEFFVKELLYDPYKEKHPFMLAKEEFEIGIKIKDLYPFVLTAISFDENRLLYEYCNWSRLIDVDIPSINVMYNIINIAGQIYGRIGEFDFSINNIFYNNGRFKFFDFEPIPDIDNIKFNERVSVFMNYFLTKDSKSG